MVLGLPLLLSVVQGVSAFRCAAVVQAVGIGILDTLPTNPDFEPVKTSTLQISDAGWRACFCFFS